MATYRIRSSQYNGTLPITVRVEGEEHVSDEEGQFVSPPNHLARALEAMPEWHRVEGDVPWLPGEIVGS